MKFGQAEVLEWDGEGEGEGETCILFVISLVRR